MEDLDWLNHSPNSRTSLFKGGEVEVGSNYRGIAIGTVWPKCCLTKGLVNLLRRKY